MISGPKDDGILDLLVNERRDLEAVPDTVYDSINLARYPVYHGEVTHLAIENAVRQGALTAKVTLKTLTSRQGWHYFRFEDVDNSKGLLGLGDPVELYENNGNARLLPVENLWLRRVRIGRRPPYGTLHLFAWSSSGEDEFIVTFCQEDDGGCPGYEASLQAASRPDLADPWEFVSRGGNPDLPDNAEFVSAANIYPVQCQVVILALILLRALRAAL